MCLNGLGKDRDYLNKNSAEMKRYSQFPDQGLFQAEFVKTVGGLFPWEPQGFVLDEITRILSRW